jgi:hypothetical protein
VRGDAALTARLLLRRTGVAGVTAAVGGVLAVVAAALPWYVAIADLSMLGEEQGRTVATLDGLPGTVWGWFALALAAGVAVLGAAIAVDRPPPRARPLLAGAAGTALLVAGVGSAARPDLRRVAGSTGDDLLALADRLPSGVELSVAVAPGPGPVLLAVAGLLVAAAAVLADDL